MSIETSQASRLAPVLLVGGSGIVGSRTARALRRLQPDLALTLGARDLGKAEALAESIGRADALRLDLQQPGLGLPEGRAFSAVVALARDAGLNGLKYAQAHGLPYVSFSDFVFDIGPLVARFMHAPQRSPILVLGHFVGGTVTLAAHQLAAEFERVDSILIAGVLDPEDSGGPAAQADFARLAQGAPRPLVLDQGRFVWAAGELAQRSFTDVDGVERQGQAFALLDVVSLAAATEARTIRTDLAVRATARRGAAGASFEAIIEMTGRLRGGAPGRVRLEMIDPDLHAGVSAKGAALAVERLLGLAGGAPAAPGLYHPETLLDAGHVMAGLKAMGTAFRRS
jgi:hypothetical protein